MTDDRPDPGRRRGGVFTLHDLDGVLEPVVSKALLDLPSPIAAEPFEPGFWRSCVTWEEIVEKATPAVVAAIRDSGYTVIALPEADRDGRWRIDGTDLDVRSKRGSEGAPVVSVTFDSVTRPSRIEKNYHPSVGPDLGAALIAAAKHATGDTQ